MSKIFFDTNLFIYMVEESGERSLRVRAIVERMSERRDELLTSTLRKIASLPDSAFLYRQWWGNDRQHVHAVAWSGLRGDGRT